MEFIPVIKSKEIHRILTKELLYVEQYQRKIRLVTREVTLETYGRIQEFIPYLGDNFVQCHQSLYVNMDQIRSMKDQSIQFFLSTQSFLSHLLRMDPWGQSIQFCQSTQ